MTATNNKVLTILSKTPIPILIVVVFVLGYTFKGMVSTAPTAASTDAMEASSEAAEEEIWTCSMHPQIQLPEPGKCPLCGMDLILAEGDSAPRTVKKKHKPKYACAMFCVPPMPLPGNCPICGMEMVEVPDSGGDDEGGPVTLRLSESAQKLAEIETVAVVRKTVTAEIRMVGKIDYDETRLGYITAWVPGRLDRLYVDYTGVPVKKGDHMVYLYSPELSTAQTELLEALRRTKSNKNGEGSILDERAGAWIEDIRDKFRLWGMTDAQIAEIEARGTASDYMTIYAPMGGIVIEKSLLEGAYVKTGTRIYTIADLSHLWVKLDAYESDLAWLRYGQTVDFEVEAYPGETFTGTVAFIAPVLDAKTRTIKIRVNVENSDGRLKPEMFVRAVARSEVASGGRVVDAELAGKWMCPMHPEIIKDHADDCDRCGMPLVRTESLGYVSIEAGSTEAPMVIPASGPLITGKRTLVYLEVPDEPGTYEGREIRLGPRVGNQYIVFDGLVEGDKVVVHGNFKIDSAVQIMAKSSMMSPKEKKSTEGASDEMSAPRQDLDNPDGLTLNIPAAFASEFDPVLTAYLKTQDALSHDQHEQAKKSADEVLKALANVDMNLLTGKAHMAWMKESNDMATASKNIAGSADIQLARAAFALLSESMIVSAKCYGIATEAVHRFHCPMAFGDRGGDWLQKKDKTENPYFGSAMFSCGVMKETIEQRPAGGTSNVMPAPRQDLDNPDGLKLDIPEAFASEFAPVLTAYLKTQDALSHDKHEQAQASANGVLAALTNVDMKLLTGQAHMAWMKEADIMTQAAKKIAGSADIQSARAAFALLSESIIVSAKSYSSSTDTVHRYHCPMAFDNRGGDWLQRKDKTENPYYGSAMFRCGVKQETIGQHSAGGANDGR